MHSTNLISQELIYLFFMLEICREIADEVQTAVKSIAGVAKAEKIDAVAEETVLRFLSETEIPMLVVSEESGRVTLGGAPKYICVLDPVDGSFNAAHGIPVYSISIAFAKYKPNATLQDVEFGLVKNLATGEVFEAVKGRKSTCDSKNISTSQREDLGTSTLCVYLQKNVEEIRLLQKLKGVRALGSVALELCYAARGDYEGLVDLRSCLRNIDIAAGKLILEEAGGVVSDEYGKALKTGIHEVTTLSIVASANKTLHKKVLEAIRRK